MPVPELLPTREVSHDIKSLQAGTEKTEAELAIARSQREREELNNQQGR